MVVGFTETHKRSALLEAGPAGVSVAPLRPDDFLLTIGNSEVRRAVSLRDHPETLSLFAVASDEARHTSLLGHSDPALTLRVYAHAMPEEETDVPFAEFDATGRPYTAPVADDGNRKAANSLKRVAFGR